MQNSLPKNAKKVFSWIRMDIYQWDQELYDGSVKCFERAQFLDWAFVIWILPNGNILMTEQEQPSRDGPFFSLPWWAFDTPDEDPLECAERELLEETWYVSDMWDLWFVFEGTSNILGKTYFYIARNCRKIQDIVPDGGEKINEIFELQFDEFLAFAENPHFVHWPISAYLFGALLHTSKYEELQKLFQNKKIL